MNQINYNKKYLESKDKEEGHESTFEALFSMFLTLVLFGMFTIIILMLS